MLNSKISNKRLKFEKILLISDTHGYIDDVIIKYAKAADLVLHAGDIGDVKVIDELSKISVTKRCLEI